MAITHIFSNKKVLITGASGFIGSHLCRRLRELEANIHAVSRKARSNETDIQWWQDDLEDKGRVLDLVKTIKPDLIFHLASRVTGSRDSKLVIPTFRSNLLTTVNLLTAASEVGCHRIIVAGSMEEPKATQSEQVPSSPYAAAKWCSSAYARMFSALYQLPVVILRLFMVYGPEQQDLTKLIPYVILCLLRKEPPKLTSGRRQIDWVYVKDVVEAFVAASLAPNIQGRTFDIGSGNLHAIRDVVDQLVKMISPDIRPEFHALSERPLETESVADIAAANHALSWRPITTLSKGLEKTVDWYRNCHADHSP